jgi:uncharacterized membrane protein
LRRISRPTRLGLILLSIMILGATITQEVGSSSSSSHPRDFSIFVSPTGFNLHPVENESANVMLTSLGGFSGAIRLTATISPNIRIPPALSIAPTSLRLKSEATANSTLTIFVNGTTTFGNYTVTVTAQGDKITHTAQVSVFVQPPPDFTITLQPSAETVSQGATRNSFYTLTSFFGFSGTVSLTISNIPVNVSLTVQSPQPLSPGGSFTGSVSVAVQSNAVPGTYFINFTGHSESLTDTATLTLTISQGPVPDFSLTISPSFLNVPQGSTGIVNVNLASVAGFNGTVSLTSSVTPVVPQGPQTVLGSTSVALGFNSTMTVVLRIITNTTTPTGAYNFTVTGASGSTVHSAVGSLTVTSPAPPDFSLSANPSSLVLPQGSSSRVFLNLTSLNGFGGTISLNATVSPSGPRLVLGTNAVTLSAGGTTQVVLALFVNSTVPPPTGNYVITATGIDGNLTHSVTIQLTVTTTGLESLTFEGSAFGSNTNVTLFLRNTGNVSISFVAYSVRDSSGDQYALTSWLGPTISPGALGSPEILIGSSCAGCTLTGNAFTFTPGQTYTIVLVTSRNNQFSFTVTR